MELFGEEIGSSLSLRNCGSRRAGCKDTNLIHQPAFAKSIRNARPLKDGAYYSLVELPCGSKTTKCHFPLCASACFAIFSCRGTSFHLDFYASSELTVGIDYFEATWGKYYDGVPVLIQNDQPLSVKKQ